MIGQKQPAKPLQMSLHEKQVCGRRRCALPK
jgi:hypothetical protein